MRKSRHLVLTALAAALLCAVPPGAYGSINFTSDTSTKLIGSFGATGELSAVLYVAPTNFSYLPWILGTNAHCEDLELFRGAVSANYIGVVFGSNCAGTPDNPYLNLQNLSLSGGALTFPDVQGSYTNSGIGASGPRVYFSLIDLKDTGGVSGTFSGDFCFSTSRATCTASSVPVPGTPALLAIGLAGFAAARRRKKA
jgi:hypothetical protein